MGTTEMTKQSGDGGKGFHPLYLWGIFYVLLTYAYPFFVYLTVPKVDENVNSQAAYEAAAKAQNGVLGSDLPLVFLVIPVALAIMNLVIAVAMKQTKRRYFLNTAQIIKYALIPFYVIGGILIVIFFLLMFTPVVIMVFVSPAVIAILSVMGWISMVGSAPLVIKYLARSVKDGKNKKAFAIGVSITQFFFGVDVIGTILCAVKERK